MPRLSPRLTAALTLLAGLALLPAYLRAVQVSGPSDAPTLLLGDRLLINFAAYQVNLPYTAIPLWERATPQRGDMAMIDVPNRGAIGLKRIIALPGETIELRENQVFINGAPLTQQPLNRASFTAWVPAIHNIGESVSLEGGRYTITYTAGRSVLRNTPPLTVPAAHYYLLGDHRDNSNDSRSFGPLPRAHIHGRVAAHLTSARPKHLWPAW